MFYVYWSWPKPKCATREGPSKSTITFFFGYYWEERWYKFAMHSICAAELQLHCVSAMRWPELCFAWSLCSRYRWSIRTRSAYVWTYLSIGGVWWCSFKHLRWAEVSDFIYWRIIIIYRAVGFCFGMEKWSLIRVWLFWFMIYWRREDSWYCFIHWNKWLFTLLTHL